MSYGQGLAGVFKFLFGIAIVGVLGSLIMGGYLLFTDTEIKSKKLITPEIILTTDGKKVDTLYIYKELN